MPDAKWKAFERDVAAMIQGKRYPANSGYDLDCEGPVFVAQCKLVTRLSLEELTTVAEVAEAQGLRRGKVGFVAAKIKRGQGNPSSALVVMTTAAFNRMLGWSLGPRGLLVASSSPHQIAATVKASARIRPLGADT